MDFSHRCDMVEGNPVKEDGFGGGTMVFDLASDRGEDVGVAKSDGLGVTSRTGSQHEDGDVISGDGAGGENLGLSLGTELLSFNVR